MGRSIREIEALLLHDRIRSLEQSWDFSTTSRHPDQ